MPSVVVALVTNQHGKLGGTTLWEPRSTWDASKKSLSFVLPQLAQKIMGVQPLVLHNRAKRDADAGMKIRLTSLLAFNAANQNDLHDWLSTKVVFIRNQNNNGWSTRMVVLIGTIGRSSSTRYTLSWATMFNFYQNPLDWWALFNHYWPLINQYGRRHHCQLRHPCH